MYIAARLLILVGLIRILSETHRPFLCAAIYAGIASAIAVLMAVPFPELLTGGLISFALASLYFWLLDRSDGSLLWWVVLVGGLAIGLV